LKSKAKLRALAIVESSLEGVRSQPSKFELKKMVKNIRSGKKWQEIFPGVASLQLSTKGTGIQVDIRITKKLERLYFLFPREHQGPALPL